MPEGRYLSAGQVMSDGTTIRGLYVSGHDWELYTTAEDTRVLAVSAELYDRWMEKSWLEPGLFEEEVECCILLSRPGYMISSMEYGPYPRSRTEAMAFIQTMRSSRERYGQVSFSDALYLEQFSQLLPTFSVSEGLDDDRVAGRYLTGGVNVRLSDSDKVRTYAPYLSVSDMNRILNRMQLTENHGAVGALEGSSAGTAVVPAVSCAPAGGEFTLPGRPALERFFREEIIDIVRNEAAYRRFGIGFPGATILYGPPGCGKTYAVEQLTKYLGWPVYYMNSGSIGSKFVHETARKVSEIFDTAIENAPSVIVIDEMEAFLSSRENARSSGEIHMEEVAEFLRRIPEAASKRVLLFGMTNMLDSIDKAIIRRGRFDNMLEVGMPSDEEVLSLVNALTASMPKAEDFSAEAMAKQLTGLPISDVSYAVREAGRLAVRMGKDTLDAECAAAACAKTTGRTSRKHKMGFQ